jgi:hypothetical protein
MPRQTLCNRDGDTAEIETPLVSIGNGDDARDIGPAEFVGVSEPAPAWVWVMVGFVVGVVLMRLF